MNKYVFIHPLRSKICYLPCTEDEVVAADSQDDIFAAETQAVVNNSTQSDEGILIYHNNYFICKRAPSKSEPSFTLENGVAFVR